MTGKCPACNADLDVTIKHDPGDGDESFTLCAECGHIFIESPTIRRNMTQAEKEELRADPSWMKEDQAEIVKRMIG